MADNTIHVIRGTVDSTTNTFKAAADGLDALLVYDANSAATDPIGLEGNNISPQAVALVGVDSDYGFFATDGGVRVMDITPAP
ncbi:hypothetical protein LJC47_07975 [Desulfosarcina sp. OttesenSCG-928-B08]|nr:hypothetical protein [Desulfosarcina sp. OttesenSCG-928-B08]